MFLPFALTAGVSREEDQCCKEKAESESSFWMVNTQLTFVLNICSFGFQEQIFETAKFLLFVWHSESQAFVESRYRLPTINKIVELGFAASCLWIEQHFSVFCFPLKPYVFYFMHLKHCFCQRGHGIHQTAKRAHGSDTGKSSRW